MGVVKKSACVQFSGGSDSTLTAYKVSHEFSKVHLLTFRHFGHISIENSRRSFGILNDKYPGKFVHNIIDIDKLFETIYYRRYLANLVRYRSLLLQFTCFACQASFQVSTIRYCLDNNIFDVRDGANTEYEDASPMQMKSVKKEIKKFYNSFGINHDSPVYDEHETERSDKQLFMLGLRETPNVKDDPALYKKFQGYCSFMPGSTLFLRYRRQTPKFPSDVQQLTLEHWLNNEKFLRELIKMKVG